MIQDLLTPEIIVIIVIAALVLVAVFFAIVTSKVSGVDGKITQLTEDIHQKVESNIDRLAGQLHSDMVDRGKQVENSLMQMGDSWRSTLDKTVADVRGEIGKLKGEAQESSSTLRQSLMEVITENAVDFNDQLGQVRDIHHRDMQEYHQQLAAQVREHAKGEHELLTGVMDELSTTLRKNLGELADHQTKVLNTVSSSVGGGYQTLAERVEQDLGRVTGDAGQSLTEMTDKLERNVSKVEARLDKDLNDMGKRVTDNISDVAGSVTRSMGEMSSRINTDMDQVTERLDKDLKTTSERLTNNITSVTERLDSEIGGLTGSVAEDMKKIGEQVDTSMSKTAAGIETRMRSITDELGGKIDSRIRSDMKEMLEVFRGFAGKVELIESTRAQISDLAENVGVLAQVLDERRARGTMGEVLVESIVSDALSPADYVLNATLGNDEKVDCLLKLPEPSGHVAISASTDISTLEVINSALVSDSDREAARGQFHRELSSEVSRVAERCIVKGETAESAVLFLPSESAFSEAHVHHRDVIDQAYKSNVWIASPSTLIAMVTVARAVIKDSSARGEIEQVRLELAKAERDYEDLEDNFKRLNRNVDELLTSATETRKSSRRIGERFGHISSMISQPASDGIGRIEQSEGAD